MFNKLVILDRDGVINFDSAQYIKSPAEWKPIPGSLEAIARLNQSGYRVVVATNQSGIGRGLFEMDTLNAIHEKMHKALFAVGGRIDAIYYCPHAADSDCDCRKPAPGMILQAARELGIDLPGSFLIGDKPSDIDAARAAGVGTSYLVASDNPLSVAASTSVSRWSLPACVDLILQAQPA